MKITAIKGGRFRGMVSNNLIFTEIHGLDNGDEIVFEPCHVLDILN